MSFLRSEGLTYSMTVVWKEKPEVVSTWPHFQPWARWLDPHTLVLDSTGSPWGFARAWCSPCRLKDESGDCPNILKHHWATVLLWVTCFFITINCWQYSHTKCVSIPGNSPQQIHHLLLFEWRLLKTIAPGDCYSKLQNFLGWVPLALAFSLDRLRICLHRASIKLAAWVPAGWLTLRQYN